MCVCCQGIDFYWIFVLNIFVKYCKYAGAEHSKESMVRMWYSIMPMHRVVLYREPDLWQPYQQHILNSVNFPMHNNDVIMITMASQITSLTAVYSTVYSDADQRKHHSSASMAFVCGNSPGPVNSPQKGPVTRKMFPFDDVISGHIWNNFGGRRVKI